MGGTQTSSSGGPQAGPPALATPGASANPALASLELLVPSRPARPCLPPSRTDPQPRAAPALSSRPGGLAHPCSALPRALFHLLKAGALLGHIRYVSWGWDGTTPVCQHWADPHVCELGPRTRVLTPCCACSHRAALTWGASVCPMVGPRRLPVLEGPRCAWRRVDRPRPQARVSRMLIPASRYPGEVTRWLAAHAWGQSKQGKVATWSAAPQSGAAAGQWLSGHGCPLVFAPPASREEGLTVFQDKPRAKPWGGGSVERPGAELPLRACSTNGNLPEDPGQ